MVRSHTQGRARRLALLSVAALVVVVGCVVAAQPALAGSEFVHKTASCSSCHPSLDPSDPNFLPTSDTTCTQCHTTAFQSRGGRHCWDCHTSAADMSGVQSAAGCAASNCHDPKHFGSNTLSCTSCHGVVQSGVNPGTSAHHNNTAYAAPTCTTVGCHGAAPHEEFVEGADCTTCHAGYDTAHPVPAAVVPPTATLTATPAIVRYGLTTILAGSLKSGTTAIAGKNVTLHQKPVGSAGFAVVAVTSTAADGTFVFSALSPTMLTTYRIVTQGAVVSTTVVKPSLKTLDVQVRPVLTIALSKTKILLGAKVTIRGTLTPARPGGVVKLTIQRKVGTAWKTQLTKNVALTAGSGSTAYSFAYKPKLKGSYRVMASVAATTELAAAKTAYKSWVVK